MAAAGACQAPPLRYTNPPTIGFGGYRMAIDQELERHKEMWLGFARLLRWSVGIIVVVLLLMAAFLL